jgi:hypothetical protein
MIRTYLSNDYIKRTIRPLFAWTQSTPKPCFPDPGWNRAVPIWPGMAFVRTGGDLVTLGGATTSQMGGKTMATAAQQMPYGLGALYVGGDGVDELLYAGINAFAVWVLGPDAEFEILAPAFDATQSWVDATDGSGSPLVYFSTAGSNQGMLVPQGAANQSNFPIARLLKVNSSSKLTIGGLTPNYFGASGAGSNSTRD